MTRIVSSTEWEERPRVEYHVQDTYCLEDIQLILTAMSKDGWHLVWVGETFSPGGTRLYLERSANTEGETNEQAGASQ